MTISAYKIDNVIKAYNKQSKTKSRFDIPSALSPGSFIDVVTLSHSEAIKADAYQKISYSLLKVLLKDRR